MRNILEYPITDKERIETLEQIKNDILAQDTVGDLRAEILQECIDAIKSNSVDMQLSADQRALEKIEELQQHIASVVPDSRKKALLFIRDNGHHAGMWVDWQNTPPPLDRYKNNKDVVSAAVLDALTEHGVAIFWANQGISCVSNMIDAQLNSRKRLLKTLERIASSPYSKSEDLCSLAEDAILDEIPER